MTSTRPPLLLRLPVLLALCSSLLLPGCAVVSVASTAVSVGVGVVGLAADAAIGTVRLTGKAVGAVLPDSEPAAAAP